MTSIREFGMMAGMARDKLEQPDRWAGGEY
jgi:hypothetical protein